MGKGDMKENISDFEIRVLGSENECASVDAKGHSSQPGHITRRALLRVFFVLVIVVATALCTWLCLHNDAKLSGGDAPSDNSAVDTLSVETLRDEAPQGPSYVMVSDTIINDIPLRILCPVGGHMDLYVGHDPSAEKNILLAAHAADLRGDDGTPAGAFVYNGELLSKGHSKYGFCAIVGGSVSIGRQIETPLFERAIEKNGHFFRQYSIVTNGKMISIPPKGKAVRRALCLKDNSLYIIESDTPESYHDFSLALEDLGVSEALALVGGDAAVMWRDENGKLSQRGDIFGDSFPLENYIVWRSR